jgi:hypothetical protein
MRKLLVFTLTLVIPLWTTPGANGAEDFGGAASSEST